MPAYEPPNAHYTQISLPDNIKPEIFIGREGCHLKRITELSQCDYLWYDFKRGVIEVWGKENRLPKAVRMLNKRIDSLSKPLPPPPSHIPPEYYNVSKELQERVDVISWEQYPRNIYYMISGMESDVMKFYFELLKVYPTNPYCTSIETKESKPSTSSVYEPIRDALGANGTIKMIVKRSSTSD
jgi:hypothetical protein